MTKDEWLQLLSDHRDEIQQDVEMCRDLNSHIPLTRFFNSLGVTHSGNVLAIALLYMLTGSKDFHLQPDDGLYPEILYTLAYRKVNTTLSWWKEKREIVSMTKAIKQFIGEEFSFLFETYLKLVTEVYNRDKRKLP